MTVKKAERIEIINSGSTISGGITRILKDKETGVLYLYHNSGLTVLVDEHGKPVLDKEES